MTPDAILLAIAALVTAVGGLLHQSAQARKLRAETHRLITGQGVEVTAAADRVAAGSADVATQLVAIRAGLAQIRDDIGGVRDDVRDMRRRVETHDDLLHDYDLRLRQLEGHP